MKRDRGLLLATGRAAAARRCCCCWAGQRRAGLVHAVEPSAPAGRAARRTAWCAGVLDAAGRSCVAPRWRRKPCTGAMSPRRRACWSRRRCCWPPTCSAKLAPRGLGRRASALAAPSTSWRPARPAAGRHRRQVAQASRGVEQERNRLAALMSELTQSVVVCNLDGRVLLYNNRARCSSAPCPTRPSLAGGAELIGLGRSIYRVRPPSWWRTRWRASSSACSAACPARRRSSSPPPVRASCCARRWRRCARRRRRRRGADRRLRADAGQHHARLRGGSARDQLLHGLTEGSRARWPTCRRPWRCWPTPTWTRPCASASWAWCATRPAP
jgi:hypothetical protein